MAFYGKTHNNFLETRSLPRRPEVGDLVATSGQTGWMEPGGFSDKHCAWIGPGGTRGIIVDSRIITAEKDVGARWVRTLLGTGQVLWFLDNQVNVIRLTLRYNELYELGLT